MRLLRQAPIALVQESRCAEGVGQRYRVTLNRVMKVVQQGLQVDRRFAG